MQVFFFINGNDQHRIIRIQQSLSDFQPFLHERQPLAVTVFVGSVHVVVIIFPVPGAGIIGRVYVPTDFDTIEKAFSGVKTAEKGIKQGLSRSNADFGSPCLLYSVMDFCRSDVRWHRGV